MHEVTPETDTRVFTVSKPNFDEWVLVQENTKVFTLAGNSFILGEQDERFDDRYPIFLAKNSSGFWYFSKGPVTPVDKDLVHEMVSKQQFVVVDRIAA